jgi:hypothetical protein
MVHPRREVFDARDGRVVDEREGLDERGVLRDGFGMRVPLYLCDSMQKGVAADAKRRSRVVQRDPMGRVRSVYEEEEEAADGAMFDAALHRPGFRVLSGADDSEAQKAYREYCDAQCNAWKTRDAPAGAYPYDPGREGQNCTINGAPGTLQRRGDALVCVANGESSNSDTVPRTMDAVTAQRIRDQAWEEMCERQRNAWKTKP